MVVILGMNSETCVKVASCAIENAVGRSDVVLFRTHSFERVKMTPCDGVTGDGSSRNKWSELPARRDLNYCVRF